jgi:hypothetical protein
LCEFASHKDGYLLWSEERRKKTRREKVVRRKFSFFASAKPTLFSYYIFIGSRVTAPQRNIKPGQIKFGQSLVFFFFFGLPLKC